MLENKQQVIKLISKKLILSLTSKLKNPKNLSFVLSCIIHLIIFSMLSFYLPKYYGSFFNGNSDSNVDNDVIKINFIANNIDDNLENNKNEKVVNIKKENKPNNMNKPKIKKIAETPTHVMVNHKKEKNIESHLNDVNFNIAKKSIDVLNDPKINAQLENKIKIKKQNNNLKLTDEVVLSNNNSIIDKEILAYNISKTKTINVEFETNVLNTKPIKKDSLNSINENIDSENNIKKDKKISNINNSLNSKLSNIAFDIVANSSYNEIPSFLNGVPIIEYPDWAQEQGIEGQVKILIDILPNGEVKSVSKVESPISDKLTQYLIKQAEMWRFKPIYKNGRPLSGVVLVTVNFSLKR